jgi:hypothetical protein
LDVDRAPPDPFALADPLAVLAGALAAFFEGAFAGGPFLALAFTLPTTTSDPMEGVIVDSSPDDHVTRNRPPLTPVTTPSRGA